MKVRLATAKEQKEQTRLIKEQIRDEEKIARDGMPGMINDYRNGRTRIRRDAHHYFVARMMSPELD